MSGILFTGLEDRRAELERHHHNSSRMAEAQALFRTTGQGSLEFPDPVDFGVVFIEKPTVTSGAEIDLDELDDLLDTDSSASATPPMPIVSAFVTDWVQDRRGYYTGAYCGARVYYPLVQVVGLGEGSFVTVEPEVSLTERVQVVHHFRFSAIAMKDIPVDVNA